MLFFLATAITCGTCHGGALSMERCKFPILGVRQWEEGPRARLSATVLLGMHYTVIRLYTMWIHQQSVITKCLYVWPYASYHTVIAALDFSLRCTPLIIFTAGYDLLRIQDWYRASHCTYNKEIWVSWFKYIDRGSKKYIRDKGLRCALIQLCCTDRHVEKAGAIVEYLWRWQTVSRRSMCHVYSSKGCTPGVVPMSKFSKHLHAVQFIFLYTSSLYASYVSGVGCIYALHKSTGITDWCLTFPRIGGSWHHGSWLFEATVQVSS